MLSAAFSAALALLVTGVGVGFGWQPMPGDASASELVVQVEPATLERLAEGATIPLATDVPAEAGRVARVRLVLGGAHKSTRSEETRLKPIGEPSTIVLTQYNEPDSRYGMPAPNYNTPNYGAPPSAAQPLATTPTPQTFDPYTQAPPAATTAWNTGTGADATASNAPTGPLQRIGAEFQTAAQPLQDGVERVGDGMRQLGQNIAGRADQLRDSLGRPLQNGLLGGRSGETAATDGDPGVASQWNGNPSQPVTAPPTTPLSAPPAATTNAVADGAGRDWNADAPTNSALGGAMGTGSATSAAPPYVGVTNGGGASATNADRWTNADDRGLRAGADSAAPPTTGGNYGPRGGLGGQSGFGSTPGGLGNAGGFGNAGTGGNTGGGSGTTWGGGAGNTLALPDPPSLTNPSGGLGQNGPLLAPPSGATTPTTVSGAPEVRSWMLGQAGNRGLEGVEATPAATSSPVVGGATMQPAVGNSGNPGGSLLGSQSWATGQQGDPTRVASTTTPSATTPPGAAPPDGKQQAAVILAWVLLFASVAGNMYLFWSYLDVRTKYRALVRKTARAVGSRFSAA
jgi:hypothetical protein